MLPVLVSRMRNRKGKREGAGMGAWAGQSPAALSDADGHEEEPGQCLPEWSCKFNGIKDTGMGKRCGYTCTNGIKTKNVNRTLTLGNLCARRSLSQPLLRTESSIRDVGPRSYRGNHSACNAAPRWLCGTRSSGGRASSYEHCPQVEVVGCARSAVSRGGGGGYSVYGNLR